MIRFKFWRMPMVKALRCHGPPGHEGQALVGLASEI